MTIIESINSEQPIGVRNFMTVHMQQHPFIFSDEKKYRIRRHLAFWLFWWIFQGFLYSFLAIARDIPYTKQLCISLMESFIFMFNHIFLAYSLMYFVIPGYLLKQRYLLTASWTLILFLITASISAFVGIVVLPPLRESLFGEYLFLQRSTPGNFFLALLAGLRGGITIGGLAAAIKLMKYWYVKEQRNLQLQKENVESQLQLLKAQVHPHFLFNTLNNIYSHTQNTSPVASKLVSGLSDMLRFMLYECNQPLVPLSKELKLIQDYINLEQIRYGNKLELHLDIPDKTNDLQIAPLLMLPLVENCFKHGTSNMLEQPWINLQIDLDGKQMHMKLLNGKAGDPSSSSMQRGIGIQNVRKRLELLYPGKHELNITDEADVFIVNLKIELEQKKDPIKVTANESLMSHA
jgi:sensor histidine kinase YesM